MPICLSSCRSTKTQPQKHPLSVWTAKTVPKGNSHDTRSRKPCSQSVLSGSTMNISAEHYRSHSHSLALCADYLYSRVSPAPDVQLVGQQYRNTSHTVMAYLRESQLHQGLQIQGRYASRQQMSYRYVWPPFMELPVFKNMFFFFFCWLGHVQHVVPSHWALMPHRTALASFISTNVSIGRYDEALTRQSPSPPSLLILPSLENRAPSHTQPPRRGLSRFLGLWLLSCNSA